MKTNKVWTVTRGRVKTIDEEYETVHIRGAVAFQRDVEVKHLSIFGQGSFHESVMVDQLINKGVCIIKGVCQACEVKNMGHLQLIAGRFMNVESSGYFKVDQRLECDQFIVKGSLSAREIKARQFHCRLSGASRVHKLIADEIIIERAKGTFSLFKKKLTCETISGKRLSLSLTDAKEVEGEEVVIGSDCHIDTLRYKKSYTIDPSSTVQHLIRMEETSE